MPNLSNYQRMTPAQQMRQRMDWIVEKLDAIDRRVAVKNPTMGIQRRNDLIACDILALRALVLTDDEITEIFGEPLIEYNRDESCCDNEQRTMEGGCINCGDPCL